ncbi:MAG: low molecular weight protein-tyrosine-phosphatase [Novosphingobium sp.]
MRQPSVLFVCLGNICRSPLAEGAFRRAAAEAGLDVHVDSAGTGGWHAGSPPDPRAVAVARANGCDISSLRARQLEAQDFSRFDHIFVMDRANLAAARMMMPGNAANGPRLLLDLVAGREGAEVADPYYGGEEHFSYTWEDVTTAAHVLVAQLRNSG